MQQKIMKFKTIILVFLSSISYQNIHTMFLDQSEEPEIFKFIKQADHEGLKDYLEIFKPDLNNIFNNQDRTPLQESVTLYNFDFRRPEKKENLKKIVKLLLTYKANLNARPHGSKSPVELNEDLFNEIFSDPNFLSWDAYLSLLNNQLPG